MSYLSRDLCRQFHERPCKLTKMLLFALIGIIPALYALELMWYRLTFFSLPVLLVKVITIDLPLYILYTIINCCNTKGTAYIVVCEVLRLILKIVYFLCVETRNSSYDLFFTSRQRVK